MAKYIYELKATGFSGDKLCKNQYTVVYENKTYYYCKVNGRDELERFLKDSENKMKYNGEFWSLNDFDINEALKQQRLKNQQDSLVSVNSRISYIQREMEQLLKTKEFLESIS
jgi:hypothetical protein